MASHPARARKKGKQEEEVDYAALESAFSRIPNFPVDAARDLLDLGYREVYQLYGRSPESLFGEIQAKRRTPEERLAMFRMAVYFAENDHPEPRKLLWRSWMD